MIYRGVFAVLGNVPRLQCNREIEAILGAEAKGLLRLDYVALEKEIEKKAAHSCFSKPAYKVLYKEHPIPPALMKR